MGCRAGRAGPDIVAVDAVLHVAGSAVVIDLERVAIGGFSDGASYALSLGLANGNLVRTVLAFSPGFLAPPRLQGRPRFFVSHGHADTVLPVERCGRRVVEMLRQGGYEVAYEEFTGGHVVPPAVAASASRWWLQPSTT